MLVCWSSFNYLGNSQALELDGVFTKWILTQSFEVHCAIVICQNRHDAGDSKMKSLIRQCRDPPLICMSIQILSVDYSTMKCWDAWMSKYFVFLFERIFVSHMHICLYLTERQNFVVCFEMVTSLLAIMIESLRSWCVTVIWKCCFLWNSSSSIQIKTSHRWNRKWERERTNRRDEIFTHTICPINTIAVRIASFRFNSLFILVSRNFTLLSFSHFHQIHSSYIFAMASK
jgi:hypothetical protein